MGIRERITEWLNKAIHQPLYRRDAIAELEQLIESEAVARQLALLKRCKKLWYYAGRWHNAECDFILHDQGVCNCPKIKPLADQPAADEPIDSM